MTGLSGNKERSGGRTWVDRLLFIDRRLIFIGVALAVAIPVLHPIGMPIGSSREASDFFRALETVRPGQAVIFSFDYEADTRAELDPMSVATWRYCLSKDIRVIALTNYAGGPGIAEAVFRQVGAERGKTYGKDFVFLGYNADWQGTILRMGESIRATFPTDHYGARLDTMAVMAGVDRYADIPLVVTIAASAVGEYWAIFAGGRYQVKVIAGGTAIQAVLMYPYYNAGQILGFLGGLKGAAEFEKVSGFTGAATPGMDAQSAAHVLMVVFILLGNVAYALKRRAGRE
jgi:hypothetical protein